MTHRSRSALAQLLMVGVCLLPLQAHALERDSLSRKPSVELNLDVLESLRQPVTPAASSVLVWKEGPKGQIISRDLEAAAPKPRAKPKSMTAAKTQPDFAATPPLPKPQKPQEPKEPESEKPQAKVPVPKLESMPPSLPKSGLPVTKREAAPDLPTVNASPSMPATPLPAASSSAQNEFEKLMEAPATPPKPVPKPAPTPLSLSTPAEARRPTSDEMPKKQPVRGSAASMPDGLDVPPVAGLKAEPPAERQASVPVKIPAIPVPAPPKTPLPKPAEKPTGPHAESNVPPSSSPSAPLPATLPPVSVTEPAPSNRKKAEPAVESKTPVAKKPSPAIAKQGPAEVKEEKEILPSTPAMPAVPTPAELAAPSMPPVGEAAPITSAEALTPPPLPEIITPLPETVPPASEKKEPEKKEGLFPNLRKAVSGIFGKKDDANGEVVETISNTQASEVSALPPLELPPAAMPEISTDISTGGLAGLPPLPDFDPSKTVPASSPPASIPSQPAELPSLDSLTGTSKPLASANESPLAFLNKKDDVGTKDLPPALPTGKANPPAARNVSAEADVAKASAASMPVPEKKEMQMASLPNAKAVETSGARRIIHFGKDEETVPEAAKEAIRSVARDVAGKDNRIKLIAYAADGGSQPSLPRRLALKRAYDIRTMMIKEGVDMLSINVAVLPTKAGDKSDTVEIVTSGASAGG